MEEFKLKTLNIKKILRKVENECRSNKAYLNNLDSRSLLKDLCMKYYPVLVKEINDLSVLTKDLQREDFLECKRFFRENLYNLFVNKSSVLNKHICSKPLGYSGDFIVANYFYENGFPASDLFGNFVDRFTIESPLAQAHMNRRKYIGGFIKRLCLRSNIRVLSLASFACGPAPEVFDMLDERIEKIKFSLIDGESKVGVFIKNKLQSYESLRENVTFYQKNIINLLRNKEVLEIEKQDFIYCAGFFDYLNDKTCAHLINYMLTFLKDNGSMLIVNVSKHDEYNVYLNMIGEWDLHHRSKIDFLKVVPINEEIRYKRIFIDPETGRNLYLVIKKR